MICLQPFEHWFRVARIDDENAMLFGAADDPDVVVVESGYCNNINGGIGANHRSVISRWCLENRENIIRGKRCLVTRYVVRPH